VFSKRIHALLTCCCIASTASSQLVLPSRWRMPARGSQAFKESAAHRARLLSHSRAGPSGRAESAADHWQFELLSIGGGSGVSSRLAGLHLAHGVQSTKHAGAHLHRWVQQRPEDARRFVAGAFAGAAAAARALLSIDCRLLSLVFGQPTQTVPVTWLIVQLASARRTSRELEDSACSKWHALMLPRALVAGAVSKTATAPLEKIRLSMMTAGSKSSILDTVMRTWRSGGVLAFFNGNAAGARRIPVAAAARVCGA